MKCLHWSDGPRSHQWQVKDPVCLMACFLYWAMFLKASGLNGVDALAIVLGNREERLGRSEEVVEPRCLSGC